MREFTDELEPKMDAKVMNQKEYLKKYLSSGNGEEKKKKKKKKLKVGPKTVKIIDDDIDIKKLRPIDAGEFDIFIDAEEAPQIAGVVDERGSVDFSDKRKWKIIANDEDGELQFKRSEKGRCEVVSDKKEISKKDERNKNKDLKGNDSDISPPRRDIKDEDSDVSLPRKSKKSKHSKKNKRDYDSDFSPLRKSRKDEDLGFSPPRKSRKDEDSDFSPPRKSRKDEDSDFSPPRKSRKDEESDLSPPRINKKNNHSNHKRSKKNKQDYDSDLSPPRKNRKSNHSNHKHSKKNEQDYDLDLSPPRKNRRSNHSNHKHSKKNEQDYDLDLSPPRKSKKADNLDLSPPRRNKKGIRSESKHSKKIKQDKDSDLSPPRKNRKDEDSDVSPPRKEKRQNKDCKEITKFRDSSKLYKKYDETNSSPSYKCKNHGSDQSPPRQSKHKRHSPGKSKKDGWKDNDDHYKDRTKGNSSRPKGRSSRWDDQNDRNESTNEESIEHHDRKMKKTLSGKTAGLQDAKALREESESFKKREAELFSKLSKEITGAGQKAIVRDSKTGRKRDLEAEAAVEREKQKRQEELNEKYEKWGRGLKQVEDREEKLKDDLYEMSKPLARYADDADLDKQLRDQEREGDPMLDYIRQKQIKEGKRKPDRAQYQGSYMPNRFGIKPGHRWDGVDRSNGYEKKWFDAQNAKLARQEEAYKWSTADM